MTAVIVPLRLCDEHRERAWEHVRAHYEREHPDWIIHAGTSTAEQWSKAWVVNATVAGTDAETLVLADADSIVDPPRLAHAVEMLDEHPWVMPHHRVRRLTEKSTVKFMAGHTPKPLPLQRKEHQAALGGGIVAIRRDAFDAVRGMDERFVGWGGEDWAFYESLKVLVGRPEQLQGILWHLYHPRSQPKYPPGTMRLLHRYRHASTPEQMQALIDERGAA